MEVVFIEGLILSVLEEVRGETVRKVREEEFIVGCGCSEWDSLA